MEKYTFVELLVGVACHRGNMYSVCIAAAFAVVVTVAGMAAW